MSEKKWDRVSLNYPLSIPISESHEVFLQTGRAITDYDEDFKHLEVTPVAFGTDGVPMAVDTLHMYTGHRRRQHATVVEALEEIERTLTASLEKVREQIRKRKEPDFVEPGKSLGEWMEIAQKEAEERGEG